MIPVFHPYQTQPTDDTSDAGPGFNSPDMKDPAFLFYPNDYLGGTMGMTMEEKGCYIELLMLQFNRGAFTQAHAEQVLSISFGKCWPILKSKFKTDGETYWNERLQAEIDRRQKFTDSRRSNALGGKENEHKHEQVLEHKQELMETENENRNKEESEVKKKREPKIKTEPEPFLPEPLMAEPWAIWIQYRKDIRKPLKEVSIPAAYKALQKLSGSDASIARDIIDQSIANGWQGLFELKNTHTNGNRKTQPAAGPNPERFRNPGHVDYNA